MNDFWNDKYALMDLLFDTNMSLKQISEEIDVSEAELAKRIKEMGLDWIKRKNRKVSRGQACLTSIIQKLLPNEPIQNEFHVGDRLRLDVYCPRYKLGFEYHGRQHFEHITRFHETYEDFVRAQQRDEEKLQKCEEQGITLVVFKYNDNLSEEVVHDRILEALRADIGKEAKPVKKKNSVKDLPYYEEMKSKRRESNKQLRAKMKSQKRDYEY